MLGQAVTEWWVDEQWRADAKPMGARRPEIVLRTNEVGLWLWQIRQQWKPLC